MKEKIERTNELLLNKLSNYQPMLEFGVCIVMSLYKAYFENMNLFQTD